MHKIFDNGALECR